MGPRGLFFESRMKLALIGASSWMISCLINL